MDVIIENEVSLKRLNASFNSERLRAEIVQVYSEQSLEDQERENYLKITYSENMSVIIWPDKHGQALLRFRVVVLPSKESATIERTELLEWAADMNKLAKCFGVVSVKDVLGITLEYRLPYHEGVLECTVISVTEKLMQGAEKARTDLKLFLL